MSNGNWNQPPGSQYGVPQTPQYPQPGYGAPPTPAPYAPPAPQGYGAPAPQYAPPAPQGYGAPAPQYAPQAPQYPQPGYGAPQGYAPPVPAGNPFAGASEAQVSNRLPPIPVGNHVLRVDACLLISPRDTPHNLLSIAEFTALWSDNPSLSPGSKCSMVIGLSGKFRVTMLGKVRMFVAAVCWVTDPRDKAAMARVTDDVIFEMYGPQNPAAGRQVKCIASMQDTRTTKNAQTGQPNRYTAYQWAPHQ